jgi:hypothetical protein
VAIALKFRDDAALVLKMTIALAHVPLGLGEVRRSWRDS